MKDDQKLIENLQWISEPVRQGQGSLWLWIGLGLFVLLVLAFIFWRRWRKGKAVLPFIASPPAHVLALASLRDLEKKVGDIGEKEFVAEVSRIVRVYIQARFGLRAPHRSTEEFLYEASQNKLLNPGHHEDLSAFLMHCDLVKFARHAVVIEGMKALLQSAKHFVEGTIPQAPAGAAKK